MSPLDHFVKHYCHYYGRYVDDCVIVAKSKTFLKRLVPVICQFVKNRLSLNVHPKKFYLQPHYYGVRFLGVFIRPKYSVANPRTFHNFEQSVYRFNKVAQEHKPNKEERSSFIASVNSYLGIVKHYKSYNLRSKILDSKISPLWKKHIAVYGKAEKIIVRKSH